MFEYFLCFFRFQEDVFGDEFVLEHVIRGYYLFFLLLYQVFYCYLGDGENPISMPGSGHAGSAGVINLAWFCPSLGFRSLDLNRSRHRAVYGRAR